MNNYKGIKYIYYKNFNTNNQLYEVCKKTAKNCKLLQNYVKYLPDS